MIRLFAAIALIVAATFPWDFQDHPHWTKVAWLPFVSGIVRPIDLLANATLYLPLGYVMPARSRRSRLVAATGWALVLSGLMELLQVWSHVRFPSTTDAAMNVVGSVAGAVVANWRAARRELARTVDSGPDAIQPANRVTGD